MKSKKLFFQGNRALLSILLLYLISGYSQASTPIEKRVPVTHVYSPTGFDTNDRGEIFLTGYLPNLCHRFPTTKVEVTGNTINVEVTSLYYETTNPFCPEMKVPFEESVTVGMLNKGLYNIVINGGMMEEEKSLFLVSESTSDAIDEFVYASVGEVVKDEENGIAELKGYNPSDCYIVDKVKTVSNEKDTYSILPIMKQIYSFCPMKLVPFSIRYEVPREIKRDKVLLHVRSMAGKAVNSLFNLKNID